MSADQKQAVVNDVTRFILTVGHDVTQDGPNAWRKYFADSPEFFMASEGAMAFPSSQAATQGIQAFAKTIDHMQLLWGDDLRIDPLTPALAVVGTSWHEIRVDTQGKTVDEAGYFTGVVEKRNGQWQFRDAHWSSLHPASS
ncbi:MAG TPA: hypothetical protein VF753_10625 [Terriglobales bacterium]